MEKPVATALKWNVRWDGLLLLGLCIAHALLYLLHFDESALFQWDAERDLTQTLLWLQGGEYPVHGPHIRDSGLYMGSMYYYLLAIPMQFSADPVVVRGFFVLLATGGIALLYRVIRAGVGRGAAAVTVVWLMASNMWFENLRQIWHSSLLPLFVALWLWAILRWYRTQKARWFILAAIPAAIAVQLHATLVVLPLALVGVAVMHWKPLGLRSIATAGALGLVILTPFFLANTSGTPPGSDPISMVVPTDSFTASFTYLAWSTIPGWGTPGFQAGGIGLGLLSLLWPMLAAIGAVSAVRSPSQYHRLARVAVAVTLLGLLVQMVAFTLDSSARYLHCTAIPMALLAAVGLHAIGQAIPSKPSLQIALPALLLAGLIVLGVLRHPGPADRHSGICGMVAQRDLAQTLADDYGLGAQDLSVRVHGLPCQHRASGTPYFFRIQIPDPSARQQTAETNLHVFVGAADVPLEPNGLEVLETQETGPAHRRVRITAYRPAIDYGSLIARTEWQDTATQAGPTDAGRQSITQQRRSRTEVRQLAVQPGPSRLYLRFWQGHANECAVTGTGPDGRPLVPAMVEAASRGGSRLFDLPLPHHNGGEMMVRIGPCADIDAVELF